MYVVYSYIEQKQTNKTKKLYKDKYLDKYTELSGRIICCCDPWQPHWETGTVILRGSPVSKHVLTPDKWYSHQAGGIYFNSQIDFLFNYINSLQEQKCRLT